MEDSRVMPEGRCGSVKTARPILILGSLLPGMAMNKMLVSEDLLVLVGWG